MYLHSPQDQSGIGTTSRQSHLHGIAFPIMPEAVSAIQAMARKELDYVQLVSAYCHSHLNWE